MKPYYEQDGITIYHGDCLDVLLSLGQFDMVFTSPPYNLGATSGAYANMRAGYVDHNDSMPEAVYVEWQQRVLRECWDHLSGSGAVFYNHKPIIRDGVALLPTRLVPSGVLLRQVIIWDRGVGMNWSPSHFVPCCEWVLVLARPGFGLRDRGFSNAGDIWRAPIEQDRTSAHPCAFPVSLPARAIDAAGPASVLDPFMGSGTTLRAAKDAGIPAIGIEISERYCEIAAKRLAQGVL